MFWMRVWDRQYKRKIWRATSSDYAGRTMYWIVHREIDKTYSVSLREGSEHTLAKDVYADLQVVNLPSVRIARSAAEVLDGVPYDLLREQIALAVNHAYHTIAENKEYLGIQIGR